MVIQDPKGDLHLEEALWPTQSRSKAHQNNIEYENGEKSYNPKHMSRLLSICRVAEIVDYVEDIKIG